MIEPLKDIAANAVVCQLEKNICSFTNTLKTLPAEVQGVLAEKVILLNKPLSLISFLSCASLKKLDLTNYSHITNKEMLEIMCRIEEVQECVLSSNSCTSLTGCEFNVLKKITLTQSSSASRLIHDLTDQAPFLEELFLKKCSLQPFTGKSFPRLRKVSLIQCEAIEDGGLEDISEKMMQGLYMLTPRIEELHLSLNEIPGFSSCRFSQLRIAYIKELKPSIKKYFIDDGRVKGVVYDLLKAAPSLNSLSVSGWRYPSFSGENVHTLQNLTLYKAVFFSGVLRKISLAFPLLKELWIGPCDISEFTGCAFSMLEKVVLIGWKEASFIVCETIRQTIPSLKTVETQCTLPE